MRRDRRRCARRSVRKSHEPVAIVVRASLAGAFALIASTGIVSITTGLALVIAGFRRYGLHALVAGIQRRRTARMDGDALACSRWLDGCRNPE